MMRRILLSAVICAMLAESVYGAAVPDDDSAIFSPYPAQPQQTEPPAPNPAPKNTPAKKKPAPKMKAPAKKPAPKRKSSSTRRSHITARQTSLQRGIELMQQERYEKAKPYLLKAIQEERNNPNAWYWYGVYHEKTGGFYQAQYFYSKAVTIDPAFEPLSRVVFYPNDDEKTPIWDPKHPARVYPVETASVPMGTSRFPNAPDDPEVPQVPVYVPPEPGASPLDGDSWSPSVYVPPRPEELQDYNRTPIYTPPDAGNIIAGERGVVEFPVRTAPHTDDIITERDKIMRVDKPLYNPPEPGQRAVQPPKPQPQPQKESRQAVKAPAQQESESRKSATVPASRVVHHKKAATTVAKAPAKTVRRQSRKQTKKTESQDVRPNTQPQRQTQTQRRQTQTQTPSQQTQRQNQSPQNQPPSQPQRQQTPTPPPARQPEPQTPPRRQNDYMPPVGQYAPDPGTIPDRPMPPVGQGNQI